MQVSINKNIALVSGGMVVLIALWAAFRPELLFVNKTVNESFPATGKTGVTGSEGPQLLEKGSFHGIAHETKGTASLYKSPDGKETLRSAPLATVGAAVSTMSEGKR